MAGPAARETAAEETAAEKTAAGKDGSARRTTSTMAFGAGARESHDASAFYERFTPPTLSDDAEVVRFDIDEPCILGSSTDMSVLPDKCVALVVTSPPYFVGKEYELAVADDQVPSSYLDYLQMLRDVFSECARVLEPGGRIAVNVANLGRKPYRSLSADIISILQDDLGLLLRGEIIWQKADGATGSLAWGSYRSAANPVLRDLTERVIVASKGRFDRARNPKQRVKEELPAQSTLTADEFMEATLDVWKIPPESARRVQHPAPYPVELPRRLIDLYTYEGDLVLDPFLGSGTTLVAAHRSGRRGVGFDLDATYIQIARDRLATERTRAKRIRAVDVEGEDQLPIAVPETTPDEVAEHFQARATQEGKKAHDLARIVLEEAGFSIVSEKPKLKGAGVQFNLLVQDASGFQWYVDVSGAFTTVRPGLLRTDTLWKTLGRANVLQAVDPNARLLVVTSNLPRKNSEGDKALRAVGPWNVFDAIEMLDSVGFERLKHYAAGDVSAPLPGYWTEIEIEQKFG
ncbi:MAG: site-specific DNA-methyltransferase [Acidimicrobiales bacterium]|nr:site-specific DNA-methyltransferase [Acidimicrobiales bacterium]